MPRQERQQKPKQRFDQKDAQKLVEEDTTTASKSNALKSDLDDVLDEIDSVLEKNAQEFVDGYIQKGGE